MENHVSILPFHAKTNVRILPSFLAARTLPCLSRRPLPACIMEWGKNCILLLFPHQPTNLVIHASFKYTFHLILNRNTRTLIYITLKQAINPLCFIEICCEAYLLNCCTNHTGSISWIYYTSCNSFHDYSV